MSTKFLRKTARRLIRDFDQFQDAYPQLIRSSDPLNNGVDSNTKFTDDRMIVFSTNNTSFPAMVPVGSTAMQSSSISALVSIAPASVEQRPSLPGSSESLEPFNESLFYLPATYENTASIAFAPGFNIPTRNKIAIPIDITSQQEKFLFRLGLADTNADSSGEFYGKASTGFCYYNFIEKQWEDIGLVPNVYSGDIGNASSSYTQPSGSNYFMAQFVGTPNITSYLGSQNQSNFKYVGYDKIGSPTEYFDAPRATRYHASSSQGLDLSNYIQQPFILERIDVKLPIVARRKHGAQFGGPSDPVEASLRDVDNLVFFLYRQSGVKTDQYKTERFLIGHESLSFYNSRVKRFRNIDYTTHNPIFSYDHNIVVTASLESVFTGSINFSMYPKITSLNFSGITSFAFIDTGTSTFKGCRTRNYWTGPMLSTQSGSINPPSGSVSNVNGNSFWRVNNTAEPRLKFESELNPDQRFLINYATGSLLPAAPIPSFSGIGSDNDNFSSANWSQTNMPYLLLPTDQLVIGLESDINVKMSNSGVYQDGGDKSILSQTSSFFKVLTENAQVTLYGSLIQEGVAKRHNSINQNLISPAVHEVITNTQDDTDQFDVEDNLLYEGSYLDNYITGSIELGTRGIDKSRVLDDVNSLGSFERFVTLPREQDIYYLTGPSTIYVGPPPFTTAFDIAYSYPIKPKNIFRPNRYGNYRDMLEQSQDYRIFNSTSFKKSGGFESYGPVYAKFVLSSSDIPVSASLTQCNNLSPYMTGTFPFVDGENTSRDALPFNVNNPFIPTTNIFKT